MTSARSSCQVMLPIRVGIDPMERLLIASFKGDPELEAFEPQVFDDAVNGKGMRVLRYRKDGRVDVYWQPGVHVDGNTFVSKPSQFVCGAGANPAISCNSASSW